MEICRFCNNIELKSRIMGETEHAFIILSNPCLVREHCLVIPKRHVKKLSELSKEELIDLINIIIKTQELLLTKFDGCDIRQNYRPFQKEDYLKVNHLHIHLQPREFKDNLYQKCQIFEKDVFRELSREELDEIKNYILK